MCGGEKKLYPLRRAEKPVFNDFIYNGLLGKFSLNGVPIWKKKKPTKYLKIIALDHTACNTLSISTCTDDLV